jgi:hypothetical protein
VLPVAMGCPLLIAPSVFINIGKIKKINILLGKSVVNRV